MPPSTDHAARSHWQGAVCRASKRPVGLTGNSTHGAENGVLARRSREANYEGEGAFRV